MYYLTYNESKAFEEFNEFKMKSKTRLNKSIESLRFIEKVSTRLFKNTEPSDFILIVRTKYMP